MSTALSQALTTAGVFWLLQLLDTFIGTQALTRPLTLGAFMGLAAGDPATGVIMGAALEGLYMGASAIGGVKPSDYKSASIIGTALVIYTGIDIEAGLVLAAAIGTVLNSLNPISKALNNLMQPIYNKIAAEGNQKKFYAVMVVQTFVLLNTVTCIGIGVCMFVGVNAVDAIMAVIPAWLLNGLNVSANVLIVVGLGLMTQAIWGPLTVPFVLVGFILSKYVGLSALAVAVLGIVIAYVQFRHSLQLQQLKTNSQAAVAAEASEEDDFFG